MLLVLLAEVGSVLPEIVALEVLSALELLVLIFALLEGLFESRLLLLKSLELLRFLVLLLLDCLGLAAVDGQLVVRLLRLDFGL